MTNNNDKVTATATDWDTDHLTCKCGHQWKLHYETRGCSHPFCDCTD